MTTNDFTPQELKSEYWKPVLGYEGKYEVSNLGRIKSLKRKARNGRTKHGCIRKTCLSPNGYPQLSMYPGDGRRVTIMVHVLVTEAFHGPRPDGYTVNHKDGDRTNNRASNLEWMTLSENQQHSYDVLGNTGPRGEKQWQSKLTTNDVLAIITLLKQGKLKQPQIGRIFGVCQGTISAINTGRNWSWLSEVCQ